MDISQPSRCANAPRLAPLVAVAIGVLAAVLVAGVGSAHVPTTSSPDHVYRGPISAPSTPAPDFVQLDRLKPQKQAEALLELAIGESDGAADQISARISRWQGRVKWNSQIATLTTAALNSSDLRVRQSGIEIELAAYGLAKSSASLDYLFRTAESSDHARKIWALWALGLMGNRLMGNRLMGNRLMESRPTGNPLIGNRSVETTRILQVLTNHLKDRDEDSRRWAVEGLALVGAGATIEPLLRTLHDDPSPAVRERAACGLAQSGMLTQDQRLAAVPQLLHYTNDPALDAQTHALAFQALADITHQRLPNDPAQWRHWYENQAPVAGNP